MSHNPEHIDGATYGVTYDCCESNTGVIMSGMLSCAASPCRLWWDDPNFCADEDGNIVPYLNRKHLDCVDCHASMSVPAWLHGACARDTPPGPHNTPTAF